ncbi:LLM class flavin-dependent oxidoreductase [Gluconobacter sp. NFX36]|uniref:LLM class flavin-dependent oxidoreductase n=1 Tax=Gluconobacter TaxID=441 RepID=UPI003CEDA693
MEIGIDSFAIIIPNLTTGVVPSPTQRMERLLEEIDVADKAGLDIFGIGEHHRAEFIDASPAVILAAAAARTKNIRLTSAVSVLSAVDPVRLFQDFATLDLISQGRAEVIVGRGSFKEAHGLFGVTQNDYDDVFAEKLDLLLQVRSQTHPHWKGRFRAPLTGGGIFPRPLQKALPIWLGVGGTPQSFIRAGLLGLPLMIAIIGGAHSRFRPLVDLYREAGRRAGHPPEALKVGIHTFGYVADTNEEAIEALWPGWHHMASKMALERGGPPATRERYMHEVGPNGVLLIGNPSRVAEKAKVAAQALGGIDRLTFQLSMIANDHDAQLRGINLLGQKVSPLLR